MSKINVAPLIAAYHLPNDTESRRPIFSVIYYAGVFGTAILLTAGGLAVESVKSGLMIFVVLCCVASSRLLLTVVRQSPPRRGERYYGYLSATILYGWLIALLVYITLLAFYFYEPSEPPSIFVSLHRLAAFTGLTELTAAMLVAARQWRYASQS